MNEGHPAAIRAGTGCLIDEPVARRAAALEGGVNIGDAETQVVDAGPAGGKELANRAVGVRGGEQFDVAPAHCQADNRGTIGVLGSMGSHPEDVAIEPHGLIEIAHRNADMRQARLVGDFRREHMAGHSNVEQQDMAGSNTTEVTDGTFQAEVEQHKGLVVVDFWAEWCGPCRVIAPVLEQLAVEYTGKLKVTKVDVDANQQTGMRFNVRSIPTLMFFKDGRHVDTVVGAVPKAHLAGKIEQHLS